MTYGQETPRPEDRDPGGEPETEDEREAQAEDPTSPARGFDSMEDVEAFDAEQEES